MEPSDGGTQSGPATMDPHTVFREALSREATEHQADLQSRRAQQETQGEVRPLTSDEHGVLIKMIREVRCAHVPGQIVLNRHWPQALKELLFSEFRVACRTTGGATHSRPGYHVFDHASVFHPAESHWLQIDIVRFAHVEACALSLAATCDLSAEEVSLATDRYRTVAEPYLTIVEIVGLYNALSWWSALQHDHSMPAALVQSDDARNVEVAFGILERRRAGLLAREIPLEEQISGPFLLPGSRFAGEPLSHAHLVAALTDARFAKMFRGL